MSFGNLPREIRDEIWLTSMEPRILCLHLNAPRSWRNPEPQSSTKSPNQKRIVITFGCTVIDVDGKSNLKPRSPKEAYLLEGVRSEASSQHQKDGTRSETIAPFVARPVPPQLHVCRESRELALKRYEFAFRPVGWVKDRRPRGSPWQQEEIRTGEKGLWVDFDRDVIFIDAAAEQIPLFNLGHLIFLAKFVGDEVAKISRLGLSGDWFCDASISNQSSRDHSVDYSKLLVTTLFAPVALDGVYSDHQKFTSFESLKELLIDATFKIRDDIARALEAHKLRREATRDWKVPKVSVVRAEEQGWAVDSD